MPFLKITTNCSEDTALTKQEELVKELSSCLAQHLSKPEDYVMTSFERVEIMTFGGKLKPCCFIEMSSIGKISSSQTKALAEEFCKKIQGALDIPQENIYIRFKEAEGRLWAWQGKTFG